MPLESCSNAQSVYPALVSCDCLLHHQDYFFFFFNDTATTEIYTLSLHDALPISSSDAPAPTSHESMWPPRTTTSSGFRSEEHTSELQSQSNLVCRLLLEKKKKS